METNTLKTCVKCEIEQEIKNFYFIKKRNHFLGKCKECCKNTKKIYYEKNIIDIRIKAKDNQKKYRLLNKDIIAAYKSRKNELVKNRRKTDSIFKLGDNISALLRISFKSKNCPKRSKSTDILGCSIIEFKVYLEKQFEPWMNWENHGIYNPNKKTWQLDHKIPVSSAKTEEEMIKLNHYTNFQPLETIANIVKSNKH